MWANLIIRYVHVCTHNKHLHTHICGLVLAQMNYVVKFNNYICTCMYIGVGTKMPSGLCAPPTLLYTSYLLAASRIADYGFSHNCVGSLAEPRLLVPRSLARYSRARVWRRLRKRVIESCAHERAYGVIIRCAYHAPPVRMVAIELRVSNLTDLSVFLQISDHTLLRMYGRKKKLYGWLGKLTAS